MVRAVDKADAMLTLSSALYYRKPFTIYHLSSSYYYLFQAFLCTLLVGSEDRTIKTWYMSDMSIISVVDDGITAAVKIMTLSPNNTFLVVG